MPRSPRCAALGCDMVTSGPGCGWLQDEGKRLLRALGGQWASAAGITAQFRC